MEIRESKDNICLQIFSVMGPEIVDARTRYIMPSELKGPICHSREWHMGPFSSGGVGGLIYPFKLNVILRFCIYILLNTTQHFTTIMKTN